MSLSTTYTKVETDYLLQQIDKKVVGGYKGDLRISDPAPTQIGYYILLDVGTYTNLGGINATTGNLTFASFDGTTWSKVAVAFPQAPTAKLPLYSAIKSANIVAETQFIDDENENIQYRVKTGQTLLTTENPANVVGTKVEILGGIKESTTVIPLTFEDGKALTGTGNLNNDALYETTSFIPISGAKSRLKITTGMVYTYAQRVIAYDANKVFLSVIAGSGVDLINRVFEQPENCAFIKITNRKDRGITPSLSVTSNTIATIESKLAKNSAILSNVPLVVNKTDGKYIALTGSIQTNANFEFAYFDVIPQEELIITDGTVLGAYSPIIYFDRYGVVITYHSNINLDGVKVVIPSGCYKIAVNNYKPENRTLSVVRQPMSYASAQSKANNADKLKDLTDAKNFYEIASGVPSYNLEPETVGIIVAGQSNAEGRIPNTAFPASYSKNLSNVKINFNDVTGAFSPMNVTGNWAFDSIVFNKISQKLNGEDFYVVKRTRGATSVKYRYATSFNADIKLFENNPMWESQLYYLEKAIRNALASNPNIKFKAILWHQGEADGSDYNPTYYRDLSRVIYYIRGIVKNPILPFIFGTIPTNSTEYNALIYDDFVKISQNIPYCYMVDMGAKDMLADGVHFNAATAQWLGEQMYSIIDSNNIIRRKS